MPKPEPRNNSATILVTSQAIYAYNGNQTKEGLLEFLSAENYLKSEVLEEPFEDYAQRALGLNMPINIRILKKFDEFVQWLEEYTKKKFKKVPYVDRWSASSKMAIVSVGIVPPFVFTVFYCIVWI